MDILVGTGEISPPRLDAPRGLVGSNAAVIATAQVWDVSGVGGRICSSIPEESPLGEVPKVVRGSKVGGPKVNPVLGGEVVERQQNDSLLLREPDRPGVFGAVFIQESSATFGAVFSPLALRSHSNPRQLCSLWRNPSRMPLCLAFRNRLVAEIHDTSGHGLALRSWRSRCVLSSE